MNIKDFFRLGCDFVPNAFQTTLVKNEQYDEYLENRLFLGDYTSVTFPLIFKYERGRHLQDFLSTGTGNLYLISDKMKTALENQKLTGWNSFPVQIFDKNNKEVKGYWGLSVTGKCGPVDYKKCEIIQKQVPSGKLRKFYKGFHIGLDKWDASDFFIPEKTLTKIITKKAANVLKENNFSNLRLENLFDIETPDYLLEPEELS